MSKSHVRRNVEHESQNLERNFDCAHDYPTIKAKRMTGLGTSKRL